MLIIFTYRLRLELRVSPFFKLVVKGNFYLKL